MAAENYVKFTTGGPKEIRGLVWVEVGREESVRIGEFL